MGTTCADPHLWCMLGKPQDRKRIPWNRLSLWFSVPYVLHDTWHPHQWFIDTFARQLALRLKFNCCLIYIGKGLKYSHGLPQPNLGWAPHVLRKPKSYHQCIGSGDSKSRFSANSIVGKFLLHNDLASLHFNTKIFPTIDFDKSYIFGILRVHINLLCSCFP